MNGILLARGKSLKTGSVTTGSTIMDITPTILHLMGCKIPKDMDGRVLTNIFEKEFIEKHP